MVELFILMMERVGLIILLAFLLVNVPYFKRVLLSREKMSSKVQLILILWHNAAWHAHAPRKS